MTVVYSNSRVLAKAIWLDENFDGYFLPRTLEAFETIFPISWPVSKKIRLSFWGIVVNVLLKTIQNH
ncbi:MAG TPA: hypothetical protein VN445_07810, partial [Rectinemataceae bacterium]|nr:hypothetical protein [Rectinemataceae bacterium]